MKIFKFGGASVKDASAVKNAAAIVKHYLGELVIVVSAMGKTTNNLERLTNAFFYKKESPEIIFEETKQFHLTILNELFTNPSHPIYAQIENDFVELQWAIEDEPGYSYNHAYDQIVCMGEIISSRILAAYLNEVGIACHWLDARGIIQTDTTYREGNVDFELTQLLAHNELLPLIKQHKIILTQGFIGGTSENFTTTLGREGSDYTAAILAYCCDAE